MGAVAPRCCGHWEADIARPKVLRLAAMQVACPHHQPAPCELLLPRVSQALLPIGSHRTLTRCQQSQTTEHTGNVV